MNPIGRPFSYIALVFIAACVVAAGCGRVDNAQHAPAVEALLTDTPEWVDATPLGKQLWAIEREFYESRQFLPAWIDGVVPTQAFADMVSELRYSTKHGLDPDDYAVAEFEQLRQESGERFRGTQFEPAVVPELDAKLTYAYLHYAADLLAWGARPRQVYANWLVEPKEEDLAARLAEALQSAAIRESLESLAPVHPQYRGLQAALVRELENPEGHEDRLKMNLERWRWAPRDLGDRYVLINVPAYQMQVIEGEKPVLGMRVIVGAPDTPTPLFSDEMTYVVFSPYWNIPESILTEETLPRLARDPDYLRRNNLEAVGTGGEVVDPEGIDWSDESALEGIRLRQAPGPENALGLVKFIFPNHFSIYLHDTPGDRLFFRDARALSHGCIRVENPVGLAEYVLRDRPEWTRQKIAAAMGAEREQAITLKNRLPVHIGYWTAWVDADGSVIYTDDPYEIDPAHARIRKAH
jgi:murein L,D-transpeptidase YcbB/YkuD